MTPLPCAYAAGFPRAFAMEGKRSVDDGGIQRLHKKAECHNQSCQRVLSGKFCHISTTGLLFYAKSSRRRSKRGVNHWRGIERQKLAHDQTADNGYPQRLPYSEPSPPDVTLNGSAEQIAASVVIIIDGSVTSRLLKWLFRRQAAASLRFKRKITT